VGFGRSTSQQADLPILLVIQADWAGETASQIRIELMKLPDGRDFEARIRKMLEMDRHYVRVVALFHHAETS
jgi:hypothetical protein